MSVHRSLIKEDLIKLFADNTILEHELDWWVIDDCGNMEEGIGSGVQREILATFWQRILASLAVGDVEKVPCIQHDHQKAEWEAICRVLVYGFRFAEYVPVSLSPVFLASCMYGEETITERELLAAFKNYVAADDREARQKKKWQ